MILSILIYPIYTAPQTRRRIAPALAMAVSARLVWFTGLYDPFFPDAHGLFASLGAHSLRMLAAAVGLFIITWTTGFRRHYRRTLESEDTRPRIGSNRRSNRLVRSPEERAIRSRKHQVFLVTYLSVGIALAVNFATAVHARRDRSLEDGARAPPFLIAFFVISGLQARFSIPAELASNWRFRITEVRWAEISRSVTRERVLLSGCCPGAFLRVSDNTTGKFESKTSQ